jgi:hypothetical protein
VTSLARRSRARAGAIAAALFALSAAGCRSQDCADTIKVSVPVGSTMQTATAALMKCGFTVRIDTKANVLNGSKTQKGLITERINVAIQLDANDRVASVDAKTQYTGP